MWFTYRTRHTFRMHNSPALRRSTAVLPSPPPILIPVLVSQAEDTYTGKGHVVLLLLPGEESVVMASQRSGQCQHNADEEPLVPLLWPPLYRQTTSCLNRLQVMGENIHKDWMTKLYLEK